MRIILTTLCLCLYLSIQSQHLKSIVYDFDGLDINQTDLPEGDYRVNDLTYQIAANPLTANDMMGDRVLKLSLNWNTNYGAFGRGISRYVEFNPAADRINFFFYNPVANNQNAAIDVVIGDDDNQNLFYDYDNDDTWKKSLTISGNAGWQFFSIPLSEFTDINPGGNGVFDLAFTQNKGMLLFTEFRFYRSGNAGNANFYLDFISFSEGELPKGNTVFDLPPKQSTDHALLGAFKYEPAGMEYQIPTNFEALFPAAPGKKLKYANWFLHWASDGTTVPKNLPGNEVQILLNNGYTPIITWEPMFAGLDRLHPSQPRLNNIISTQYDSYIDQFANKIKSYNDTIIIRFMHEFEGDWYPWSITHNGEDPQRYVTAFRKVVNRFRALGATKVKWMWCVNSDYYPYKHYNWIVPAYPGNEYVDIIATDIYNNHWPPQLPWWRSFRWQTTESYYYLTRYFPNKPLYICEVGCRERFNSENSTSESKGQWYARMDKELQSNFRLARALVFFHANPDQNWLVNSSSSALQSLTENVWNDLYYFKQSGDSPPPPPPPSSTCTASGNILREVWTNISGTSVNNIPLSSSPTQTFYISTFSTTSGYADNYGQRVRGFICPPETGNYTFWIASDDNSELWLSTSDNPSNKIKIASVSGWTNKNEWTKYSTQQSASIALTAGQRYYIEALHKEGSQGDHLSVGWQLPNGTLERPVPGSRLSPPDAGAFVNITSPANNTNFTEGSNINITASAGGGNENIQKVEFYSGTIKIGEDATSPYSYSWNNVALGNYQLFAKTITNGTVAASSTGVNVSVSTSVTCNASGTILREIWENVSGTSVSSIPVSSAPTSTSLLNSFSAPLKWGDNYGQRISGFVCAPLDGNYTFWIASDDNSELWLSTNDQPSNKMKIATVAGWTNQNEWTKYSSQKSAPINLVAGQKYYIEALHKEGSQGDHLSIGWQLPNSALERPIPGSRLSPATSATVQPPPPTPTNCAASIQPGGATTFCSGGNVILNANTGQGFYYQWIKNGLSISGETASAFNATSSGDYQVKISYPGCNAWSSPTKVDVTSAKKARITPGGPTTFCEGESVILYGTACNDYLYQWKKDGADISGATAPNYTATTSGSYQLKIVQGNSANWSALTNVTVNNCGSSSAREIAVVQPAPVNNPAEQFRIIVFPNPTTGMFTFDFCLEDVGDAVMEIKILNTTTGLTVYNRAPELTSGCVRENIDLPSYLPTGVYLLQIKLGNYTESAKLILSK